jgi:hypothetical protein
MVESPSSVTQPTRVYDMNGIIRILTAVAVVFAVTAPVIAAPGEQLQSQAQKRLEQQRKDLVRNFAG